MTGEEGKRERFCGQNLLEVDEKLRILRFLLNNSNPSKTSSFYFFLIAIESAFETYTCCKATQSFTFVCFIHHLKPYQLGVGYYTKEGGYV